MPKRFLEILRQNIGLKLLSVLIAVVIWYVVVEVNDPLETSSYQVKVTTENESYITNGKQIFHIDDSYKTVMVYLKANRSTLRSIRADDISVTADLTQIVDLERDPVMVPLTAYCRNVLPSNITLSRTAIPITIENIASKEFPVTVDTGDSIPGQNYEVGRTTPDPEQIVINGPESIVNNIDSVIANIDVTGMTQSSTKQASIVLMNKNQEPMSPETIEDDLTLNTGDTGIRVAVELWRKQSDVTLQVEYGGEPAEGYKVTNITTTPETVTVAGSSDALKALKDNGNTLTIPGTMVDVTGASADIAAEVNLQDIMPENMRPAKNTAEIVTVYLTILSDATMEKTIDVDEIEVKNLAENLTLSYDQTELIIRVHGITGVLEKLKDSDIRASIDAEGMGAGDELLPVEITLPDGVELEEEAVISVHLKEKAVTETAAPTDK